METAISRITEFDLTKQQIHDFIEKASNEAINGTNDLLYIKKSLKALSEIVKGIDDNISHSVMDEAAKYEKTFDYRGAQFQLKYRTSYDFENCNDSLLKEAEEAISKRKENVKTLDRADGGCRHRGNH